VLVESVIEAGARSGADDDNVGEQAVAEGVLRRDFLAGIRDGAV